MGTRKIHFKIIDADDGAVTDAAHVDECGRPLETPRAGTRWRPDPRARDTGLRGDRHVVDIGATKMLLGQLTSGGVEVRARRVTPEDPAKQLGGWLRRWLPGRVEWLGVAFSGGMDSTGLVTSWPNRPAWVGFALGDVLNQFAERVEIRDDGEAAALGEALWGVAHGEPDVLVAVFGTGLGGAVVLDHTVRRVRQGESRTLGHLRMLPSGLCGCGGVGCAQLALQTLPPERRLGQNLSGWPEGAQLARFLADLARMLAVPTVVLTGGLLERPVLRKQLAAFVGGEGVEVLVPARPGLSSLLGAGVRESTG